jgi:hypothetical protein
MARGHAMARVDPGVPAPGWSTPRRLIPENAGMT